MTSTVEYFTNCIITICNIGNNYLLQVKCGALMVISLEEFPVFTIVPEKQEYELRLDSQQIESILKDDEMINLHLKGMEDSLLKDPLQRILNSCKELFEDEVLNANCLLHTQLKFERM